MMPVILDKGSNRKSLGVQESVSKFMPQSWMIHVHPTILNTTNIKLNPWLENSFALIDFSKMLDICPFSTERIVMIFVLQNRALIY